MDLKISDQLVYSVVHCDSAIDVEITSDVDLRNAAICQRNQGSYAAKLAVVGQVSSR